jgi:Cof subfamily protein (haloacid dehalogenase superfamily)
MEGRKGPDSTDYTEQKDINMKNQLKKGIVSFDVDMTLLNHQDWKIPISAMKALERLRTQYYIVIATGRDMDAKFSVGLTELIGPDAMIQLNGTKITADGRILYEHLMDQELVRELLQFTEGKSFAMGVTVGSEDYFMNAEYVTRHDMIRWGQSDRSFQDPWKLLEMPVRTMAYIGKEPGAKLVEEAFPQVKLPMFSSREGADVIERKVSKADGLARLCEYWEMPVSQTIAFGDSMNDYEIIKMAGTGVAMGNSPEDLKKIADYVTAPIGEDGIWKACIHLGLFHEDPAQ